MTPFQRTVKYLAVAFAIFLIISIISGILGAIGMVFGLAGGSSAGEMRTIPVSQNIHRLDLEISASTLRIVPGDRFCLESNLKDLNVREDNGTLKISEDRVDLVHSPENLSLTLTVPEGFVFEEADLDTGAGKVEISALSAHKLSLELGAGATEIDGLRADKHAEISTGAGKLTIRNGDLNNLSMDLGVGKVEFTGKLTGSSDVEFGVGESEITLLGSRDDYEIRLDKGLGSATLDGEDMHDGGVYGTGANRVDVEGGVGSIRIRFSESD